MNISTKLFSSIVVSFVLAASSTAQAGTAGGGGPNGGPATGIPGTPNEGFITEYGMGCGPSFSGPIQLEAQGTPSIGQLIDYKITNAQAGTPCWLMLGVTPLALDLTGIGAWGCHLYVDPLVFLPDVTNPFGEAKFPFAIPNNAAVIGQSLYAQGLAVDLMANAFGASFSNGVAMVFGP